MHARKLSSPARAAINLALVVKFVLLGCIARYVTASDKVEDVAVSIKSGNSILSLTGNGEMGYGIAITAHGHRYDSHLAGQPLMLMVDGLKTYGVYHRYELRIDGLVCYGRVVSGKGSQFEFTDIYSPLNNSAFSLDRAVEITLAVPNDHAFNSLFGLEIAQSVVVTDHEYFVPAIWYKTNFEEEMAGVLAANSHDDNFLFREDRLPLPLVMARSKADGSVVSLLHLEAKPTTITLDRGVELLSDDRLKTGSLGISCEHNTSLLFMYPGAEGERNHLGVREQRNEWAYRSHPIRNGAKQNYKLLLDFGRTDDYAAALRTTWRRAFDLYAPAIVELPLSEVYGGLLATLEKYYVPADKTGGGYDAPGFPFSVFLPSGEVRVYNYQMGFIGRQISDAYSLLWQGLADKNRVRIEKGESILDFWANESLTEAGLPRTWYDPASGASAIGSWRDADTQSGGTAMRVACGGMESLLFAWRTMNRQGSDKSQWLAACRRFGDWLVDNQNPDGSYYLAYDHQLTNGRHMPTNISKYTTTNPISFLIGLYQATEAEQYRSAALRAGDYAWSEIHERYKYIGSVIDNPNVIDRESGQEALYAFLSLYDLTADSRWLAAAIQAAEYTVTWSYCYEVPAEIDAGPTDFPRHRSIIGQTVIATGHSAADLGFAFSAYHYYRLYLLTRDTYYLTITKLLLHNTKQSMNWDGKLYPGQAPGLQLEAFTVCVPRRQGVMECLSWNYAAHLEPLIRFQESFGSFDLAQLEELSIEERLKMINNSQVVPRVRK